VLPHGTPGDATTLPPTTGGAAAGARRGGPVTRREVADHLRFFTELGVAGISRDPAWRKREAGSAARTAADAAADLVPAADGAAIAPLAADAAVVLVAAGAAVAPVAADAAVVPVDDNAAVVPVADDAAVVRVALVRSAGEALAAVRQDLGECTRCKLATQGRTQIVFGVGNPAADLMFVGEAPGADEDIQGVPFVGRAGQLLTKMIEAMGLSRDDVYIANVLKCRPPGNRNPEPDEIGQCEPFLFRQIASIQPKVIIALGAFAARTLLRTDDPISRLRGREFEFRGATLIPTFHPSFLLRSPGYKREAWDDLKKALALLGRVPPAADPPGAARQ
jgi:DNA polymerase